MIEMAPLSVAATVASRTDRDPAANFSNSNTPTGLKRGGRRGRGRRRRRRRRGRGRRKGRRRRRVTQQGMEGGAHPFQTIVAAVDITEEN